MAGFSRGFSLLQGQAARVAGPAVERILPRPKTVVAEATERLVEDFTQSLPCVIYECNLSMELTFLSGNILELVGFEPRELLGTRTLWEERVAPQDQDLLRQRLEDLKKLRSVSLLHRLVDRKGMLVWVSHGLRYVTSAEGELIRGCLLGVGNDLEIQELWQSAVDRFVHKIGNHFQILNFVISSLNKALPPSRETEVLHNTVESLIELTRLFAAYSQVPSCWKRIDISQLLRSVLIRWQPPFMEKGVALEEETDSSIEKVLLLGDPFLLELALSHILQNALEATEKGGRVNLYAKADLTPGAVAIAKVGVRDSGSGIEEETLGQVLTPFFTTKEGHGGLGLSMAYRFVEMHSGRLHLKSVAGKGTEVEIELPAVAGERPTPP